MTLIPWIPSKRPPNSRRDELVLDLPWDDLLVDAPVESFVLQRADCCVANAAVRVTLPAREGRARPAELLLCAHHHRGARATLVRLGASVFDEHGRLVAS